MLGAARWSLVSALVTGWLILPGTASAIVPQVHDHGKFFKPETVAKADAQIKMIEERYKKDVVVETFDKIPDDVKSKFKYDADTPQIRDRFYRAWRDDLANRAGVNGIIVIINRDQYHGKGTSIRITVAAGGETQKRDFTVRNTERLNEILEDDFAKNADARLLEGLKYIEDTLHAQHKTTGKVAVTPPVGQVRHSDTSTAAGEGSGIMGWICIGLCVLVGIWLIFALIRAISGGGGYARGPGYGGPGYGGPGYGYGGGGGGGFMSGLMGGLFGAVAGNWIYNNMFGGHSYHQSAWGESSARAADSPAAGSDDYNSPDQGQGFAGTSGDVDGGGSGDADGGDAGGGGGGGDWGGDGGDAGGGGGGGDWGGGGGGDAGGGDWGGGGGGGGDWGGGGGGGGDW